MWSRRAFLQHGSLALAAVTCLESRAAQPRLGPLNLPIGLQLYAVREDVAKDLPAALKAVAAIGYREVELAGAPKVPAAKLRALLQENGLTAPSMHVGMSDMQTEQQSRIDYAKAVGAEYLVISFPWTADSRFRKAPADSNATLAAGMTLDDWKWNADQLNSIAAVARKSGIRCGYHNHNIEFRTYNGVTAYDELLRLTDPALVTMEMDIGWVVAAGADPVSYLTKHADRISLLHVKDVAKGAKITTDRTETQTTEVGGGQVDWRRLFAAIKPKQVRHYFVEQENFARPPLEAMKISFDYLNRLENATRAT